MLKRGNKKLDSLSWAEVDLSAIRANYRLVKRIIGPKVKMMAVVKSDAYGHGLIPVSLRLSQLGVDYLAVASVFEALSLRRTGIKTAILVIDTVLDKHLDRLIKHDISIAISGFRQARVLSKKAKAARRNAKIHIEIDTGMGRTGLWHGEAGEIVKRIVALPYIDAEGIFTHFPCADSDPSFTNRQISSFKNLLNGLRQERIYFKLIHTANSAAIINFMKSHFNMVRPGLILYGLSQNQRLTKRLKLKPAMSFKTRIVFLKQVSAARSISYGRTYTTRSKRTIATLACGYADGYNRLLSNKAEVIARGRGAKVVGRICMDSTMVDVTGVRGIGIGDEVVLFGREKNKMILAEELAHLCKTIAYEIVCGLSKEVKRFYRN